MATMERATGQAEASQATSTTTTATATTADVHPQTAATSPPVARETLPSAETKEPVEVEERADAQDDVGTGSFGVSNANTLSITILMISGARSQLKIDPGYLQKHNVRVEDPFDLPVLTLKECIWKDWKDEWESRPQSAHFIRLIHFGRLLDDRHTLREYRLNKDTPNVVHMTIRPADTGEDDTSQRSAKLTFGQSRTFRDGRSASCRCVIL